VSEYGLPQFPGAYGKVSPPALPPPQRGSGASKPFLVLLLIIACIALGALLSWGIKEHGERARLSDRNYRVENAYVAVLAKRNDLASFLTDQRTRLYRLMGHWEASGRFVTVAWQPETRTGLLIGDRVPLLAEQETYAMWYIDPSQHAVACGVFQPEAAGTYYQFHVPESTGDTPGFIVSVESDRYAQKPGRIMYETR
jgi:hypothetical protein